MKKVVVNGITSVNGPSPGFVDVNIFEKEGWCGVAEGHQTVRVHLNPSTYQHFLNERNKVYLSALGREIEKTIGEMFEVESSSIHWEI